MLFFCNFTLFFSFFFLFFFFFFFFSQNVRIRPELVQELKNLVDVLIGISFNRNGFTSYWWNRQLTTLGLYDHFFHSDHVHDENLGFSIVAVPNMWPTGYPNPSSRFFPSSLVPGPFQGVPQSWLGVPPGQVRMGYAPDQDGTGAPPPPPGQYWSPPPDQDRTVVSPPPGQDGVPPGQDMIGVPPWPGHDWGVAVCL